MKILLEQSFEPYRAPKEVHCDEDGRIRSHGGGYKCLLNARSAQVITGVPYTWLGMHLVQPSPKKPYTCP